MKTLFFKELRTIRPYIYLGVFLALLDCIYSLLVSYPDRLNIISLLNGHLNESMEYHLIYLFFAFSMASMLIPREYDDRTIEFLDSLPLSKSSIFFSKYGAAVLVTSIYPIVELLSYLPLHAMGYSSINPSFHLNLVAGILFLHIVLILILQAICFFLSLFRRFAWIIIGIAFWLYQLRISEQPGMKYFNPFEIISIQIFKESISFPWALISFQIFLGTAFLLIGFIFFSIRWNIFTDGFQKLREKRWGKIILWGGMISSILVIFILISSEMDESDIENDTENKISYTVWNTSIATTNHFRFVYPTNIERQALQLIFKSDSLYNLISNYFHTNMSYPVFVDMTREYEHYAGTANWLTINMDVPNYKNIPSLMSTFLHELTHVYIDVLSDRRMMDTFNTTRFFHEGLATYMAYKHFKKPTDYDTFRFISTVVYSRKDFNIDLLLDSDKLTEEHDETLVYPFGEKFIQAIIKKYGENAPLKIIKSFSDSTLNRDLTGKALWIEVFRNAGFSFEGVTSMFYGLLEEDIKYFDPKYKEFTSIKTKVEIDSSWVIITPTNTKVPDGWSLTCRFRIDKNVSRDDYSEFLKYDKYFKKYLGILDIDGFDYQIGYKNNVTERKIFQPWIRIWL